MPTRPAAAKNIQFHCWGLAVSPGVVAGELDWTSPGEAAWDDVVGVVETDANVIVESVDATDAVVVVVAGQIYHLLKRML